MTELANRTQPLRPSSDMTSSTFVTPEQQYLRIVGPAKLKGHLPVSGAKNSALVVLAGTILASGVCQIRNLPNLADINRMNRLLASLGLKLTECSEGIEIDATHVGTSEAPYDLVSRMRASFFVIGPLVARLGQARIPLPGGCAIGARPVDLHVRGLQAMGADVHIEHGVVDVKVNRNGGRLQGAKIYLDYPSVGATETIMMAATLADGETIIENAAQEPEVVDLANFCRAMGARITGAGTNTISVVGTQTLHGVDYSIIPDRIEAGTFLVAAAITQSELTVGPVIHGHVAPVIAKLEEIGLKVQKEDNQIYRLIPNGLRATDIETLPFPGFPTDMQAQFTALLALCEGSSVMTETVFENRLHHVAELNRMGADIVVKRNNAIIRGVPFLSGAPIVGSDLRASAAMILAALAAHGVSEVRGLQHLDRGYDDIEAKFRNIGADIQRLKDPSVEDSLSSITAES
ncbi:MAG: UDP-N-acetylglucosamine 1-carboxyvinyltransferase [Cyanobacteria bacterium P01_H01_bin.15]